MAIVGGTGLRDAQRPPDGYSSRRGGEKLPPSVAEGDDDSPPQTFYSILTLSRRSGLRQTEDGLGLLPERGRDGHGGALGTAAGTVLPLMSPFGKAAGDQQVALALFSDTDSFP